MDYIKEKVNPTVFLVVTLTIAVLVDLTTGSDILFWIVMSIFLWGGFILTENKRKNWWKYLTVYILTIAVMIFIF